jgi:hypothetical protein
VVGDLFELDLALPLALGARVGLVVSPHTPRYEIDFVGSQERARVLNGLPGILELAGVAP